MRAADGARSTPMAALRLLAVTALPLLVALLTAPIAFGGTVLPWQPRMADLDVYRRAGEVVLSGGDIYASPEGVLPFLYPPVAALLSVPLALPPAELVQIGWLAVNVLALLAVLHRLGLTGWVLCLATTGTIWFVDPVKQTLAYGQLGIFLVALVLLDLVPGPRAVPVRPGSPGRPDGAADPSPSPAVPRARWLPAGVLTGLGAAVKLTPGIFVPFLLMLPGRRHRAGALGAIVAFAGFAVAAALVLPFASIGYWGRLATGDSGTESYHYLTNQAVLGTWLRLVGLGGWQSATGMLLAAAVAALGLWAGVSVVRRAARAIDPFGAAEPAASRPPMAAAVCVVGVAGLLASPISWSHHFVWVVPLGVVLARRELCPFPDPVRVVGWLFVAWVSAAPFMMLPAGADVELSYQPWQAVLASVTPVLGIAFLVAVVLVGGAAGRTRPASGIWTWRSDTETWSYAEVSGAEQPPPATFRSAPAPRAGIQSHDASTGGDDGGPETAQP